MSAPFQPAPYATHRELPSDSAVLREVRPLHQWNLDLRPIRAGTYSGLNDRRGIAGPHFIPPRKDGIL